MSLTYEKTTPSKKTAHADARGRVALGPEAVDRDFSVSKNEEGQYILTPVVQIPERELWLHKNRAAMDSLERGIADAAAGRTSPASFAEYADIEIED